MIDDTVPERLESAYYYMEIRNNYINNRNCYMKKHRSKNVVKYRARLAV